MQGMGSLRLGSRAVMYTAETLPKGKNRVMGTIQIMTGFMHIGFGIVLTMLTNVYTSVFVIGEIPFLGGVSFIISGCLSIGAEKSPTECAVKGSQTMNVISAIFALLGIVAFIVDLNLNGLYRSTFDYEGYLVLGTGSPSCCSSSPSWSSASPWPPPISGAEPLASALTRPCSSSPAPPGWTWRCHRLTCRSRPATPSWPPPKSNEVLPPPPPTPRTSAIPKMCPPHPLAPKPAPRAQACGILLSPRMDGTRWYPPPPPSSPTT
ncbi:uncharacterized protein LOC141741650 isoform X3 [Larus michahellis]|uniref:uncharacterized protein LOC141741650 isoform X3 n=1 Tax=Larus michahellis TaxID=119627 RepID=UPI003D9AF511